MFATAIVAAYLLGQNIPLPLVRVSSVELPAGGTFVQMLQAFNGSSRQNVSIFALGIMPYMMASILLMLKNLGRTDKKRLSAISPSRQSRILTLLICSVMAFLRTREYEYTRLLFESPALTRLFAMVLMIGGVYAIIWLTDLNSEYGIGGMTIVIIVNIIKNILRSGINVWAGFETGLYGGRQDLYRILVLFLIGLFSMILIMLMEDSEFRIPVQKVMIYNEMSQDNYMAFKLDPAGMQPMMYVMAFYIIPFLLLSILAQLFPERAVFALLADKVQLDTFTGIGFFLILFFFLALALAMVQLSPSDLAEEMMKRSDCIIGLRPGKETEVYLRRVLLSLSISSSLILGGIIALPMVLRITWGLPQEMVMVPMSLMFVGGISRSFARELRALGSLDSYQEVL